MGVAGYLRSSEGRFVYLFAALVVLLLGYPYLRDDLGGAFLGGLFSLVLLVSGVYALRTHRLTLVISGLLAALAMAASGWAMARGVRGDPLVEGAFLGFYAFTTVAIFVDVVRSHELRAGTMLGAICVYLLIGVSFGTLYDLVETLNPGSFHAGAAGAPLGFRQLIFFSFMTLTTVGYGDITPATTSAQSLATAEGVTGVLYVAMLIARIVGIYSRYRREDQD